MTVCLNILLKSVECMLSDVNDSNVMFNIQLKAIIPPQKKKCLSLIINYQVYPCVTISYNKYNLVITYTAIFDWVLI